MATRSYRSSLIIVAAALALGGCEDKAPSSGAAPQKTAEAVGEAKPKPAEAKPEKAGATVASCNLIKSESLCREYGQANLEAAGEEHIKGICDGLKGEFKLEACPKDKRVGSCATPEGTKVFYSEGAFPLTADQAEKQCKEGIPAGEWKAG